MYFLGINWEIISGSALLKDGHIVASVSEERFTRNKKEISFPKSAIKYCLQFVDNSKTIDGVGIASLDCSYPRLLYQSSNFSVSDFIREQHEVWYPQIYEGKQVDDAIVFKDKWVCDQYPNEYWREYSPAKKVTFTEESIDIIADFLEIDRTLVVRIEHHYCHAYYGYHFSPFQQEKVVVITIDGAGDDGINATVSIVENGKFRRIYATDKCILGRVYSHITLLLGMGRKEHEYKVMGLAPYAKSKDAYHAYEIFSSILSLDGIEFVWNDKPPDSYFYFKEKLEGIRFDNIAAGLQMWVENTLCKWVTNIVKETGVYTVVVSGGVSMNVKAMGKVAELPCVRKFFVPGTGSDDSNCIGAAIGASLHFNEDYGNIIKSNSLVIGTDAALDSEKALEEAENDETLIVERGSNDELIAKLLEKGFVIGRCVGRMEFGQRALGNRSILADPINTDIVPRINSMIKSRDFWMPFAPVVLDTHVDRYLINPKDITSPHMTIAFKTTDEGWRNMKAACHPSDRTARAQILLKKDNEGFYDLLESFEKLTGRGALLNTSFNLHGHPIVNTTMEAYKIFKATEMEGLLLGNGLILKKEMMS